MPRISCLIPSISSSSYGVSADSVGTWRRDQDKVRARDSFSQKWEARSEDAHASRAGVRVSLGLEVRGRI